MLVVDPVCLDQKDNRLRRLDLGEKEPLFALRLVTLPQGQQFLGDACRPIVGNACQLAITPFFQAVAQPVDQRQILLLADIQVPAQAELPFALPPPAAALRDTIEVVRRTPPDGLYRLLAAFDLPVDCRLGEGRVDDR